MAVLQFLTTTHFDFGAVRKLPAMMKELGITHPMITTDQGLMAAGVASTVRNAAGEDTPVTIFDATPENPTEEAVLSAFDLYRKEGCDGVIALGGGSPMDLGKAVACLATNGGEIADYATVDRGKHKDMAPLIAIPTTAGTGSEVSVGFVVVLKTGRKATCISPRFIPARAICDPELTLGLPAHLTAATGMDAVTHAIEAVCSPVINPPAEAVGLDALDRAVRQGHLERATTDGSDREARWQMMMASTEGAMAFIKGLGAVHSMSHSAGRLKDIRLHHGTLNAVILPTVLRFNADSAKEKYERIRHALQVPPHTDLADLVEDMNRRLKLPGNLTEMGLGTERIPDLVDEAQADLATPTNPRKMTPDDFATLYEDAMTK